MSTPRRVMLVTGFVALGAGALSSAAQAAAPVWKITVASEPTNFVPGSISDGPLSPYPEYVIAATNVGLAPSSGPIVITDTLPAGLRPLPSVSEIEGVEFPCEVFAQTVTCTVTESVPSGSHVEVVIPVAVDVGVSASVIDEAQISGGGTSEARATTTTTINPEAAPFGFVSGQAGLSLAITGTDGAPATQAGSHPSQFTFDTGFPTLLANESLIAAGHVRDLHVSLPPGMIFNPQAPPLLCSEAQLEAFICPDASAVGLIGFQVGLLSITTFTDPLYAMVPPPGAVAEFGFVTFFGLSVHLLVGVDGAGHYELSLNAEDLLARELNPAIGIQVRLWGNPSDPGHDIQRGQCASFGGSCPVGVSTTPFLSMPSSCSGSLTFSATVDSWENPGEQVGATATSEDPLGNPVGVDGCNTLEFEPSFEATPSTNLADSPTGLEFKLHVPQNEGFESLASANVKDVKVTLPEGMALNPSFADGLGVCTQAQLDLHGAGPASCPDASKLGSVEVKTPLLDHPLSGALYLAKPFENPFGSLLALYLAIHDPSSGVVVKLAGKVDADLQTGQLTASFGESPELPFEDAKVSLFSGTRAALRTPTACATYATKADITPWSAPEGADAHSADAFLATLAPNGAPICPRSEAQAPSKPSFAAGTISPRAGAYSPFLFKVSREDGSQRLGAIDATLPEGLLAKLAGVPYCSEAQVAAAKARSNLGGGVAEQQRPSCPLASEVGVVNAAAGAGVTPLYLQGHAYLAGPYRGAPLSIVTITPAIAGPFDLGAVVVRVALHLDPQRAQVHAVSDPLPTILAGIPLDIRSIVLKLDRPGFTSNPTSCEPMALNGASTSSLGQGSALISPFQLGNCRALDFNPKLSLRLRGATGRGAHPALRASLAFPKKGTQANISSARLSLPRSVALDRKRIGAVCSTTQLAAGHCPKASAYGQAKAITPLLEEPLRGPLYLRSKGKGPPELVAELDGQLEVPLGAQIDTDHGRLGFGFKALPDAPIEKLTLELKGGRRGLLVNRSNLCKKSARASAGFEAQNGKAAELNPPLANSCKKSRRGGHR